MKVTNVKFNHFPAEGITVALGQVTLDKVLTINFALKNGQHGYFISLGNDRKGKDGKWYSCVYMTKELKELTTKAIEAAYNKHLAASAKESSQEEQALTA